jgi:hypothetical protein
VQTHDELWSSYTKVFPNKIIYCHWNTGPEREKEEERFELMQKHNRKGTQITSQMGGPGYLFTLRMRHRTSR